MMRKLILALSLIFACAACWAQKTAGLIVRVGDTESQFALTEIKEITFAEDGMTLVKTDDVSVEFPTDWQIRFGEVVGICSIATDDSYSLAQIYNAEGKLVMEGQWSTLRLSQLPKGIYIIKLGDKSLKIIR